jgi:hypothetical protein
LIHLMKIEGFDSHSLRNRDSADYVPPDQYEASYYAHIRASRLTTPQHRSRHPTRDGSESGAVAGGPACDGGDPIGDHTLCAVVNDLRVPERLASAQTAARHQRPAEMSYRHLLGIKWSQVQILSARPKKYGLSCVNAVG